MDVIKTIAINMPDVTQNVVTQNTRDSISGISIWMTLIIANVTAVTGATDDTVNQSVSLISFSFDLVQIHQFLRF